MLDKDTAFNTVFQLWFLQFVFLFLDVFTSLNVDAFGSLNWYSFVLGLLFLGFSLFNPFTKVLKVFFLCVLGFSSLFLFISLFESSKLFNYEIFYLLNVVFSLSILLVNYFRFKILEFFGNKVLSKRYNWRNISILVSTLLFFSQFLVLKIWFSILVGVLFVSIYWYFSLRYKWLWYVFGIVLLFVVLDLFLDFIIEKYVWWIGLVCLVVLLGERFVGDKNKKIKKRFKKINLNNILIKTQIKKENIIILLILIFFFILILVETFFLKNNIVSKIITVTIVLLGIMFTLKVKSVLKINKIKVSKKTEIISLITIIVTSIVLRLYILNLYEPFIDEMNHINAAKRILIEGTFNYDRGMIFTYLVALSYKLFGIEISSVKVLMLIISSFNVLMFYIILRRISSLLAICGAYLFSISPFAIGMGTYFREYELYLLFTLIVLYSINLVIFNPKLRIKIIGIGISISPIFGLIILSFKKIDPGTFPSIIVVEFIYIFSTVLVFRKEIFSFINKKIKKNKKIIIISSIALFLICITLLSILFPLVKSYTTLSNSEIIDSKKIEKNSWVLSAFFNPNHEKIKQWFNYFPWIKINIGILLMVIIFFILINKEKESNIYLISLGIMFFLFILFFNRGVQNRYAYIFISFYVIYFAFLLYTYLSIIIKSKISENNKVVKFTIVVILLIFFSPINSLLVLSSEVPGTESKLSGVYNSDIKEVIKYLKTENITNSTTLITSHPKIFIFNFDYAFIPKNESTSFLEVFPIESQIDEYDFAYNVYSSKNYKNINNLKRIIEENKNGYIIIDKNYYLREDVKVLGIIKKNENFNVSNKQVRFIGEKGSMYVYKWKE